MKKEKLLLLLSIPLLLWGSCATSKWKETLISSGNTDNAINNVITDFLHTSKLSKQDSIFEIIITDTNNEILIIGIGGAVNKIYPKPEFKIGTYDDIIPSKYRIECGKLFYWNDTAQVITQEVIDILKKYDHIDFSWQEEYVIPPLVIDDGKEGVIYYFCRNNFKNYKKTGANTINKHYSPPVLKCN